ncbi:GNAT family N-acetyltransferase [Rugosimonospora africana]|uniref:N-acetyltransferase n=1 Tax=Rugosimonospora africana TaxID=556532 RepID=A0A8J3R1M1_9ACTN|nr:GNAT family N-acetyltransferase [Rugosimonospora africana]GIH19958.1 N-acetyltransferase [Rugosimonospora africana]
MLIEPRDSADPLVRRLALEQHAEVAPLKGESHAAYRLRTGIEFMVGFVDVRPVGCGALQRIAPGVGEVRWMYVRPAYRGQGLSKLILAALEERACELGHHSLRLETGRLLTRAISLYRAAGFRAIPAYGEYAGNPESVCFEKPLLPLPA